MGSWKEILFAALIAYAAYSGYSYVYDKGYAAANDHWQEQMATLEKERDDKIAQIEKLSTTSLEQSLINDAKTRKELTTILANVKGSGTTVPDCNPSKEYLEAYNAMILKVNK